MTEERWFAVIDTAQAPDLLDLVRTCRQHECLVAGKLDPELGATLPWLVAHDAAEPLAQRWPGGGGEGGLLTSSLPFASVRQLLKKFLNARLPDGRLVCFRFFDPVVLGALFRAATSAEQAPWSRGIERYLIEAEELPGQYHARFVDERLHVEFVPVAQPVVA